MSAMRLVFLGLSITSSWGNGHATTYRALLRSLAARGHDVLFLERDVPWYAGNRDLPSPPYCRLGLYSSLEELRDRFTGELRHADLVVVGSFVPDGTEVARWALEAGPCAAFYDIDTPVTLAALEAGGCEYLTPDLVPGFDLYLSFTGGPVLELLARRHGARRARALHCSADTDLYRPVDRTTRWALGYLGTYSPDRREGVERLLAQPAAALPTEGFVVAGPGHSRAGEWPSNVELIEHLPPARHPGFYCSQGFTLNVTRRDMRRAGWSPSVRLFEAAACGVPVISDFWPGLEDFFEVGSEILVAGTKDQVLRIVRGTPERERRRIGERARARFLADHSPDRRAEDLEEYACEAIGARTVA